MYTILLYGATGYSGRLIAAEAKLRGMSLSDDRSNYRVILAGRNRAAVTAMARELSMEGRVFGLDDPDTVLTRLEDVDVILNAAGPFAMTGPRLVRAALGARCHYVDISGEADVYMRLDDLSRDAIARRVMLVSGAGHTSAASDVLLDLALTDLENRDGNTYPTRPLDLGAIRIGMSRITTLSRGSLETLWRSMREQVRTVRFGYIKDEATGESVPGHTYWHVPVGQLERTFDFHLRDEGPASRKFGEKGHGIASAANVLDTVTARRTVERRLFRAHRIESYVEVGDVSRMVFQAAPLLTPLAATSWGRNLVRLQLNSLPEGPTEHERRREPHVVVLEIEDQFQSRVIHWAWRTPNPYDFTARVSLKIAARVAKHPKPGWSTPAEVLHASKRDLTNESDVGYLRGCRLEQRPFAVPEFAS